MANNITYFDWGEFKLIPPPRRNITFSEVKISPKTLTFSSTTVAELGYASDIAVMFGEDRQQLVIMPSIKKPYTCSFYDSSMENNGVTIHHNELINIIRTTMKWPLQKGMYRVPGVKIPCENDVTVLCFDLAHATCGRRKAAKFDPKVFLAACPNVKELMTPGSQYVTIGLPANTTPETDESLQGEVIDIIQPAYTR